MSDLIETKSSLDSLKASSNDIVEGEKPPPPPNICDDGLDEFFLQLDIDAAVAASKAQQASLNRK